MNAGRFYLIFISLALCYLHLFGDAHAEDPRFFAHVGLRAGFPVEDEFYDGGELLTGSFDYWFHQNWGIGLAAGYGEWSVSANESIDGVTPSLFRLKAERKISGDVVFTHVGPRLLHRFTFPGAPVSLRVHVGADFVSADSDAKVSARIEATDLLFGGTESVELSSKLEVEDTILGVAGVDILSESYQGVFPFVGVGYQHDFEKGEITVVSDDPALSGEAIVEESDLTAFIFRFGVLVVF